MPAKVSTPRLIVAVILAIFVYGVIAAMLGTILPGLSERFKLSADQNGYIALAQALGLIIASLSAGPLVDNKGKKTALVLGLALIAIALFLLPNATGFGTLMAYFFLLGLGGGIIVTSASALVSDISEEKRASALNLLNLFFGLGGMATPFVASYIFAGDAMRLIYPAAIVITAVLILHAATAMPPPSGARGFKTAEAGLVLKRPVLWLLSAFMFLYVACEVGVWNWLTKLLVAQNIPDSTAQSVLSLGFAFGMLLGRVVVSRILMAVRAPTVTLGAAVLMAITTYFMLQATGVTMVWIAVFCAGLAMAPVFPTTLAMVGDAFPKMTATAMGIVITAGWIGLAVSSRIIGAIAGTAVKPDPAQLKTALLIIPIFSVTMILVNLILRPMMAKAKAAAGAA